MSRILLTLLAVSCGGEIEAAAKPPEGELTGVVTLATGDAMNPGLPMIQTEPVKASVRLYALQRSEVVHWPGKPETPALQEVTSTDDGRYVIRAPAGTYTLLVEYDGQFYPHKHTDWWHAVVVEPDVQRNVDIAIDKVTE